MLSKDWDIMKMANIRQFETDNAKILQLKEGETYKDVLKNPQGKYHVYVPKGASYQAVLFSEGSDFEWVVHLTEEKASATIQAGYILKGETKSRLNINLLHETGDTYSNQKVRGVLFDKAQNEFLGLIRVWPYADKTEAHQSHKALLLSSDARVGGQPELEIFADDVICSHGNAIGEVNKDQLFYLESRGLSEKEAKNFLIHAFLAEVLGDFPDWEPVADEALNRG